MSSEVEPPDVEEPLPSPLIPSDPDTDWLKTRSGVPIPAGYPGMVNQLRTLLDNIAASAPPPELVNEINRIAEDFNNQLPRYRVPEREQVAGQLLNLPGRGQLLVPAYTVDELDNHHMAGTVRFSRHHLGNNGAVHGGAVPLAFDDMLGRLALVGDRPKSRTAFLHVDYRAITPIDEDLRIEGWFDLEEGRKRFLRGEIRYGHTLCASATGLFVALRTGQP